jgi:hypothetical protein
MFMNKWHQELKDNPAKFAEQIIDPPILLMPCQKILLDELANFKSVGLRHYHRNRGSKMSQEDYYKKIKESVAACPNAYDLYETPEYKECSDMWNRYFRDKIIREALLSTFKEKLCRRPKMKIRGKRRRARNKAKRDAARKLLEPIKWEPKDLVFNKEVTDDAADSMRMALGLRQTNRIYPPMIIGEV